MKEPMVKVDDQAHSILKKYKEILRKKGIKVSLGGTIREMDRIIKDDCENFSQKDLKEMRHAIDKLKKTLKKYNNPSFSDAIKEMDGLIEQAGAIRWDSIKKKTEADTPKPGYISVKPEDKEFLMEDLRKISDELKHKYGEEAFTELVLETFAKLENKTPLQVAEELLKGVPDDNDEFKDIKENCEEWGFGQFEVMLAGMDSEDSDELESMVYCVMDNIVLTKREKELLFKLIDKKQMGKEE